MNQSALEEASLWFAKLMSSEWSSYDQSRFDAWKLASLENRQAWAQIEALNQEMTAIEPSLGMATLKRANQSRRQFIKQLAVFAGVGLTAAYAYRHDSLGAVFADAHTSAGEIRHIVLEDGTSVYMNTKTSVDVQYTTGARNIRLLQGEVMVTSAHDVFNRNLSVETKHGLITALGTRFNVKLVGSHTEVTLLEGLLSISTLSAQAEPYILEAGNGLVFGEKVKTKYKVKYTEDAWTKGFLVVYDQPLSILLETFSQYKNGWLLCDPKIADLRISGTFRVSDIDASLNTLEQTLPIRIKHYTRFYTRIEPL